MICNLGVVSSNLTFGSIVLFYDGEAPELDDRTLIKFIKYLGRYQSGQLGQTVNLLAYAFVGSNPALPTFLPEEIKK